MKSLLFLAFLSLSPIAFAHPSPELVTEKAQRLAEGLQNHSQNLNQRQLAKINLLLTRAQTILGEVAPTPSRNPVVELYYCSADKDPKFGKKSFAANGMLLENEILETITQGLDQMESYLCSQKLLKASFKIPKDWKGQLSCAPQGENHELFLELTTDQGENWAPVSLKSFHVGHDAQERLDCESLKVQMQMRFFL